MLVRFNSGLIWSNEEAHEAWKQWIVKNGFRDISELVSSVMEEAHAILSFYALLDKQLAGEQLLSEELAKRDKDIAKFHRSSLSDKLDWLLGQPSFSVSAEKQEEVRSITAARNCIAHRGGVVGPKDVTENGKLVVKWLAVDLALKNGDVEVPFEIPKRVEKGDVLVSRVVRRTKEFSVGDRVIFDEKEFSEIAFTIVAFAQAIAGSLQASGEARGLEFKSPAAEPPTGDNE
jgi:hypothetical protein